MNQERSTTDEQTGGHEPTRATNNRGRSLGLIVSMAMSFCFASAAEAEIIQLSATAFVHHGPANESTIDNGTLITNGQNVAYFAELPSLKESESICRFTLVYADRNQNDDMKARLMRKTFSVGSNPVNKPKVIASLKSSGNEEGVRIVDTTDISNPLPNEKNSFYYVEVNVVTTNLEVLGVRIDTGNDCPM